MEEIIIKKSLDTTDTYPPGGQTEAMQCGGSGAVVWPTCIISTLKSPGMVGGLL